MATPSTPPNVTAIAIAGASGRMGRLLVEQVLTAVDVRLMGALEHPRCPELGTDVGALVGRPTGVRLTADARARQMALLPFYDAMFVETNPGPVKVALALMGRICPEVRLPLAWPSEATVQKVLAALREAGVSV